MDRIPIAAPWTAQKEAKRARESNKVAYSLGPRGINLPSALSLTEGTVERVCEALREILQARGT